MWARSFRNSQFPDDMRYNSQGVRYLSTNCDGTCTGPAVQEIYQDVPVSALRNNHTYLYGINVRCTTHGYEFWESIVLISVHSFFKTGVRCESEGGMIQVMLQALSSDGRVLWQDSIKSIVPYNSGTPNQAGSSYSSMFFLHSIVAVPLPAGTDRMRFAITPLTSETFDILDAVFNLFPAVRPLSDIVFK